MTLLHCLPRTAHATPALLDLRPTPDDLRSDVIAGLSASPKTLSSKYFYDERGSQLFEAITRQPEYDLTRTEIALLQQAMPSIRAAVGAEAHVVELGSGSARKTQLLLDGLDAPVAYTPVEISREMLLDATARLAEAFPDVQMLPVCADFTRPVPVPRGVTGTRWRWQAASTRMISASLFGETTMSAVTWSSCRFSTGLYQ